MVNRILFISSILCGGFHWIGARPSLPFFQRWVWNMGIITSIANHGTTHDLIRFADRGWMVIGIATDIGFLLSTSSHPSYAEPILLMGMAMSFYGLARHSNDKWKKISNFCHIMSHISLTLSHLLM